MMNRSASSNRVTKMRMRLVTFVCLVALACGCRKDTRATDEAAEKRAAEEKAGKDRETLRTIAPIDGFGYASGNYHTGHNHPVLFALSSEKKFVLMGSRARIEIPLSEPKKAIETYDEFLRSHTYSPNGKPPRDDNTYVLVDGGKMVAVPLDQIFPQMPPELRARFNPEQLALLEHTSGIEVHAIFSGYYGDRPEVPAMWAYSQYVVVGGKKEQREFPMAQASDAFAEYEALLHRTGVIR
jgi:hypothetical protein